MARRYARDNRGRFAPKGTGATARGGRLKTAGGNKRQTQTMQASAAPKGTISKPAGLKPGAIKPKVSSARQEATDRLKIKTETRRKLRTDRASVVPAKPSGPKTMKAARPQSTVAKPRTKGNTKAQVASRVERKAAANRANLAAITRAERTGAGQGRQYERALKRQMTLDRAQNFLQTGKLPGRDNSIAAQRKMRQAKDRLAATNAARAAAAAAAKPRARKVDLSQGAFESRASATEKRARAAERAVQGLDRSNPQNRRAFNRADALRSAADSYSSLARRGRTGDLPASALFQGRFRGSTAPKLTRSQKAAATRQANKDRKLAEQIKAMERARRR
jgi:hypothetical protein